VNVIDLHQVAQRPGPYSPGNHRRRTFDFTRNGAIDVIDLQRGVALNNIC
jgi:hypothetical protein